MIQKGWFLAVRFSIKMAIKLFYRRIELQGYEDYPLKGPILVAPNHQNAFMDALVAAVFAPRPIHFLTRADVFKKGFADRLLRSFNMMPVYRQRDGKDSLQKNEEVFEDCFKILRNNGAVLIFPEASHLGERRLRNLSRGFTRIVFGALENNEHLDIRVVPIGLNYSNYYASQSRLLVNFGAPLRVADYAERYAANPAKAMSQLRNDLQAKLAEQIIHIEGESAQRAFDIEMEWILPFYLQRASGFTRPRYELGFYRKRGQLLDALSTDDPYFEKLTIYDATMAKHKLQAPFFYISQKDPGYWVIQTLLLLVFLPVFGLAWLIQWPTYRTIRSVLHNFVKDRQFYSSVKLVGGLLLFPVFALFYAALAAILSPRPLLTIGLVLGFYLISVFIIRELRLPYRYFVTGCRMEWMRRRNRPLFNYLRLSEKFILKHVAR